MLEKAGQGRNFHVVPVMHIDLAWKRGRAEFMEIHEIYMSRLVDLLESRSDYTAVLEQAEHLRALKARRPDLFSKIKRYVEEGRLEAVGGMVSTAETNVPSGESLARNLLLGFAWFKENLGAVPETGWLIDTFGVNSQMPQVLRQFGISRLMANRLGADKAPDAFVAEGIDGTSVLLAGRDVYYGAVPEEHVYFRFVTDWSGAESLLHDAEQARGEGPFLVVPYTENEYQAYAGPLENFLRPRSGSDRWFFSLPSRFLRDLEARRGNMPAIPCDLNPEFSGTFSNRIAIRLANREAENLLLSVEAFLALRDGTCPGLGGLWWRLAVNQFHDMFTGSHPSSVYQEVMDSYASILRDTRQRAALPETVMAAEGGAVHLFNALPYRWKGPVSLHSAGVLNVLDGDGNECPARHSNGRLEWLADIPAMAWGVYSFRAAHENESAEARGSAIIENETLRLECDNRMGILRLIHKPDGRVLIKNAARLISLQPDDGSFQIESPSGAPVPYTHAGLRLEVAERDGLLRAVTLSGRYPAMKGIGEHPLDFSLELALYNGLPGLYITARLVWRGECSRVRLSVETALDCAGGVYEIPFGAVERAPYGVRANSRGEWPAHRFVLVRDGSHGLALINSGVPGAEAQAGVITQTLLRAPATEYAGMTPDSTSSQHGEYAFRFLLLPFAGDWRDAAVARAAQAFNSPPLVFGSSVPGPASAFSVGEVENGSMVFSCLKPAEDGSGDRVLRFYEGTGRPQEFAVPVKGFHKAWLSDLRETRGSETDCSGGALRLRTGPFEIVTVRLAQQADNTN